MFEFTECGGEQTNAGTVTNTTPFNYSGTEPPQIPSGFDIAFIELDTTAGDIDLTEWQPGCDDGCLIRVRKSDTSTNNILFTDSIASYRFVNKQSEFFMFRFLAGNLQII